MAYPSGSGGTWSPQNYDHTFMGPITLRYAIEESRNIPAIKVMEEVGVKTVLDYAKRFGFSQEFPPYLPIALGAGDSTLMEVTSAYTTFPNQGIRMKPWTLLNVKDREGNLLEQNRPEPSDVIGADSAFVICVGPSSARPSSVGRSLTRRFQRGRRCHSMPSAIRCCWTCWGSPILSWSGTSKLRSAVTWSPSC